MRRVTVAAIVAAVLLAATGCLTPLTSQQPLTPVPTPASPLVGVYEPGAPGSWSQIAEFTAATGVKPGIVVYFSSWNEPFSTSFAQTAWDHDAYVLVQLEPKGVTLASIAAGGSDGYLRSYADAVVAFGHPVILSFGHEMNGNWYPWGYGHASPAMFVAAWRHVVRVFRAAGAANATWLWAVNSIEGEGAASSLSQWWPGTAWVSWTGVDGYYYQATDTFDSVFGSTIADIRTISSAPLLIAETAVGTTPNRESQIDGLFAGVSAERLAGVVWFDAAQHAGLYHQDWRLEDDPAALAAFTAAVATHLGG
ncbi:MAG TPA: glycosyl hydrolase [Streptosporangiaceae bacterium]|nr:glycosyl hydrolase [Streptosporangiaceae bacterium]